MHHYWKADFITELTDEAIAAHVGHGRMTPHVSSSMHLHPINGAAQRVGADETAFGHRDKSFAPVIVEIWPNPAEAPLPTGRRAIPASRPTLPATNFRSTTAADVRAQRTPSAQIVLNQNSAEK
jgi:hypothetical protein